MGQIPLLGEMWCKIRQKRKLLVFLGLMGVLLILLLGLIIFRSSLAEWAIGRACKVQGLACVAEVDQVGWRSLRLSQLSAELDDVAQIETGSIAVRYEPSLKSGVNLDFVSIEAATVILDLRDNKLAERLGDFAGAGTGGEGVGPGLGLSLKKASVRLITEAGEVNASLTAHLEETGDVQITAFADPVGLQTETASLQLDSAELLFALSQGEPSADLNFRLSEYHDEDIHLDTITATADVRKIDDKIEFVVDASIEKASYRSELVVDGFALTSRGEFTDALESATDVLTVTNALSSLDVNANAQHLTGFGGSCSNCAFLFDGRKDATGRTTGQLLARGGLTHPVLEAGQLSSSANYAISLDEGTPVQWWLNEGAIDVHSAVLNADWLTDRASRIIDVSPRPLKPFLRVALDDAKSMSDAVNGYARFQAFGTGSDVFEVALVEPFSFKALSGAELSINPVGQGASLSRSATGEWRSTFTGSASLKTDRIDGEAQNIAFQGGSDGLSLNGDFNLEDIKSSDGRFGFTIRDLSYARSATGAQADIKTAKMRFSGTAFGVDWSDLEVAAGFHGESPEKGDWTFRAYQNVSLTAHSATVNGSKLGAFRTRYAPDSVLARVENGVWRGAGRLSDFNTTLDTGGMEFDLSATGARLDWLRDRSTTIAFGLRTLNARRLDEGLPLELSLPGLHGALTTQKGWKVEGGFESGQGAISDMALADIKGLYEIGNSGSGITGSIRQLSARGSDQRDDQRFSDVALSGGARLSGGRQILGVASVKLADKGDHLGRVSLTHNLKTGEGSVDLMPTELVFNRFKLQPADILPPLRGLAANVGGAVVINGHGRWTRDKLVSNGGLEFINVGFVTAAAGVFEGVFGRLELSDLLNGVSPAGQEFSIQTWNPGIPLNNGAFRFQLTGEGRARLEAVNWPFAGGVITAEPMEWDVHKPSNTLVILPTGLELSELVETLRLENVDAGGRLNGKFPIVFSVGSARIENADLLAEQPGGYLRYQGQTGEGAAQTNANAKLLFDALKDFQYTLLKMSVDGDIAGELTLALSLVGQNPAVLEGYPFNLNVNVSADLLSLFRAPNAGKEQVDLIVNAIRNTGQ